MPIREPKKDRFQWHNECRFTLLVNGSEFFPAMLEAIEHAKRYILLEQYLVQSGHVTQRFIKALIAARQRGVTVLILLDDYGARFLEPFDREKLLGQDIKLAFYNPFRLKQFFRSLRRDHRKLLLVDGEVAYTGGAGLHDVFQQPFDPQSSWHEVMVRIEGPIVADWLQVFSETWEKVTGSTPDLPVVPVTHYPGGQPGRIALSAGLRLQEIKRSFINRVRQARQRVWLTTPYFVPSRKIRRALIQRARAGVDVRLLLPGPFSDHVWVSNAARGFYSRLLRNGVRIFEYQPVFTHAKIGLCDNWCTIGSSNLDRWNQRWNLDANQEIEDHFFSSRISTLFRDDFALSVEIDPAQWRTRSRLQRLREWLSGRMVMLLELIARSRRN